MNEFFEVFEKAKLVLTSPLKFFKKAKKEKGVRNAFIYYAVLSLTAVILGIISYYLFAPYYNLIGKFFLIDLNRGKEALSFGTLIYFSLISWSWMLVVSFISAGFLHIWLKIFGGKGKYEDTYKIYSYSMTPQFLLKWIPFIGLIAWIWGIFLLIVGTQEIHKMSRKKAMLIYLIPIALILIIVIALMYIGFSLLQSHPELLTKTS